MAVVRQVWAPLALRTLPSAAHEALQDTRIGCKFRCQRGSLGKVDLRVFNTPLDK